MVRKNYLNTTYSDYTRYSTTKSNGLKFKYVFKFSHIEKKDDVHIKDPERPEYIRVRKNGDRLVYYEDLEQRERIVIDENNILKRGRPAGSKDKVKRARNKDKLK